ncbi:alpha-glucosidase [Lacticaseibacillus rhamnosus]|uniref:glycoside hydrolase family 13 protein n=1 Tax=Lacticaseibacillus rhamnosus TaxID=47715 RepID=UPI0009BEB165|nr:alpha-glucosidase [Lacticaseibacillus rhamnosus]MCT3191394.1 alpha-glucosidase [Lacticaseibacillus rhamnosus]MCT3371613.1 alpha-glucosidase [Lacticaseibacillus rhamnosus]
MNEIPWWKNSVVYQVYPKSFNDSNGDGIGDLNGITEKLDYLADLGVDVLWLNPIYRSPQVDNGYDISNYRDIEPQLGTMADFEQLLHAAHDRQLKIILDLVVNHTSDQHPWFKAAKSSVSNKYHDYYIWKKPVDNHVPNNWGSSFGGSAWAYEKDLGEYYLHLFARQQPDLNWENPKVRQEVYELMRFWLDKGVDGFRMDVISLISKDPAYPDGPLIQGKVYGSYYAGAANGPKVHNYLQEMHEQVLSHYDIMTVGETPHTTAEQAQLYTAANRHELDMVFHFDHMHLDYGKYGKFSTNRFKLVDLKAVLARWETTLAQVDGWNSLYWSNHDQPRPVTRFGDEGQYRIRSAKMLGTVLHMLQGTPFIFEGEELGLKNVRFDHLNQYNDLETKNSFSELTNQHHESPEAAMEAIYLHSRDNARTPMPWDGSQKGGFTTGKPWLELNPDHQQINAEKDLADSDGVYHYYQRLIKLRHEEPLVTTGDFELLAPDDPDLFIYLRRGKNETLLVAGNFSESQRRWPLPDALQNKQVTTLISNVPIAKRVGKIIILPPFGSVVYKLQ